MSNFYNTRVVHSMESPMLCDLFPIKLVVIIAQLSALLITIGMISKSASFTSNSSIFEIFLIVFLVASLVAFLADYELFMHIHYWVACVMTIVPLFFSGQSIVSLYEYLFNNSNDSNAVYSVISTVLFLCAYIFYIWSCRQLIKSLGRHYVLPFFKF